MNGFANTGQPIPKVDLFKILKFFISGIQLAEKGLIFVFKFIKCIWTTQIVMGQTSLMSVVGIVWVSVYEKVRIVQDFLVHIILLDIIYRSILVDKLAS